MSTHEYSRVAWLKIRLWIDPQVTITIDISKKDLQFICVKYFKIEKRTYYKTWDTPHNYYTSNFTKLFHIYSCNKVDSEFHCFDEIDDLSHFRIHVKSK